MFAKLKDSKYIIENKQTAFEKQYDKLEPGFYKASDIGGMIKVLIAFEEEKKPEGLITFKDGITKEISNVTKKFFDKETIDKYNEMKITHKMGILLYGPPGTGKTSSALMSMYNLIEEHDAICLNGTINSIQFLSEIVTLIRKCQDNPIVIFIDEIEYSIARQESSYLTFLDGDHSISGVITIGCTNFIDKIPERIKDRKSRIKYSFLIDKFPIKVYEEFISTKLPNLDKQTRFEIAYKAEDSKLTIDQLKHVLIDYYIDNIQVDDAIKGVKKTIITPTSVSANIDINDESESEDDEDV